MFSKQTQKNVSSFFFKTTFRKSISAILFAFMAMTSYYLIYGDAKCTADCKAKEKVTSLAKDFANSLRSGAKGITDGIGLTDPKAGDTIKRTWREWLWHYGTHKYTLGIVSTCIALYLSYRFGGAAMSWAMSKVTGASASTGSSKAAKTD